MRKAITLLLFLIISAAAIADNIRFKVSGHVLDNRTMQPIQYAIVKVSNLELWAATDANGMFIIENVPQGTVSIEVSTLGYVTRTVQFNIRHNTDLKKRMLAYSRRYPENCKQTDTDPETGCMEFEIHKGRFSFRLTAPYSEERREAARRYARENNAADRLK